jgi:hypothetical protein
MSEPNVIRLATARDKPAVRACSTCRYQYDDWGMRCGAVEMMCTMARLSECNGGTMWEPKPPSISALRRFKIWLVG